LRNREEVDNWHRRQAKAKTRAWIDKLILKYTAISERTSRRGIEGNQYDVTPPFALNSQSWQVVEVPGDKAGAYQSAMRMALEACQSEPDEGWYVNTLGVALYRVGKYADALVTLARSDELNGGIPADVAFIAMAHQQLGHTAKAQEALTRLRALMNVADNGGRKQSKAFLREAESLIAPP